MSDCKEYGTYSKAADHVFNYFERLSSSIQQPQVGELIACPSMTTFVYPEPHHRGMNDERIN
jgi:hypothetical protein